MKDVIEKSVRKMLPQGVVSSFGGNVLSLMIMSGRLLYILGQVRESKRLPDVCWKKSSEIK